jgi:hypothetical protein
VAQFGILSSIWHVRSGAESPGGVAGWFRDASRPVFSASTNPSFARARARTGAAGTHLLGMQSEREWARAVVSDIARRYLAHRRQCVAAFVDRHFSLAGTLRLHRRAIGWDLLRVPANLRRRAPHMWVWSAPGRTKCRTVWPQPPARLPWSGPCSRYSPASWPIRSSA